MEHLNAFHWLKLLFYAFVPYILTVKFSYVLVYNTFQFIQVVVRTTDDTGILLSKYEKKIDADMTNRATREGLR
jgi:hypothetical protein